MSQSTNQGTLPASTGVFNIFEAIKTFSVEECESFLKKDSSAINTKGWYGLTTLHTAALRGNSKITQLLLDYGADINQRNNYGETALHFACKNGSITNIHMFLQYGANAYDVDYQGRNAIHHAALGGNVVSLHYLSEVVGMAFHLRDNLFQTPLHICCQLGNFEAVHYLLKNHRSDCHWQDVNDNFPLHFACQNGNAQLIWMLLRHSSASQLLIKNKQNQSSIDLLKQGNTFRHNTTWHVIVYLLSKNPESPPSGPLSLWYFLLIFPCLAYFVVIAVCNLLISAAFRGPVCFALILLMAGFIWKQNHRLPHPCRWANPMYASAFAAGIFNTLFCFFWKIYPSLLWPGYFILSFELPMIAAMLYLYKLLLFGDPGICTTSKEIKDENNHSDFATIRHVAEGTIDVNLFCTVCEIIRPADTKHCKLCEKCISAMDHHCLFLLNCVAKKTHRNFIIFIMLLALAMSIFSLHSMSFLFTLYPELDFNGVILQALRDEIWVLSMLVLNIISVIWALALLQYQFFVISNGQTTVSYIYGLYQKKPSFKDKLKNIFKFFKGTQELATNVSIL